jgi:hypothetical protein
MRFFAQKLRMSPGAALKTLLGAGAICFAAIAHAQGPVEVRLAPGGTDDRVRLELGVTLTQATLRPGGDKQAMARAIDLLANSGSYINTFVMGWGTLNPEPFPGQYDWASLDRRMELIRKIGATPILTLCCAPDWMRGEPPGRTDWARVDEGLRPDHFDDYVDLVRRIALRYPDVKHYQVWAEYKGFWTKSPRHWAVASYTDFYNRIYDALKAISPDIKVGGPYAPMAHWLSPGASRSEVRGPYGMIDTRPLEAFDHWLAHKHGADWMSIDGGVCARDGCPSDMFAGAQIFTDATMRALSRSKLPLWWSEWTPYSESAGDEEQSAQMASTLIRFAPHVAMALKWGPESDGVSRKGHLWSDTRKPEGGKPYPFHGVLKQFGQCFPKGAPLKKVTISAPGLAALASDRCAMIVNQTPGAVRVRVGSDELDLAGFETRFVPAH